MLNPFHKPNCSIISDAAFPHRIIRGITCGTVPKNAAQFIICRQSFRISHTQLP